MPEGKIQSSVTMTPFEIFLRTGLQVKSRAEAEVISLKFNPWHDPRNGQFTTSGAGIRSGGGSYGGGGATGSWSETQRRAPARQPKHRPNVPVKLPGVSSQKPRVEIARALTPHHTIERNRYSFEIDHGGRTRRASGELRLDSAQNRSRRSQRQAGGSDRLGSDDGGHYIARRFGGPSAKFNHFAQDRSFNRGEFRVLENTWAKEIVRGKKVFVDLVPHYYGQSQRPDVIAVRWTVDGRTLTKKFSNYRGGK